MIRPLILVTSADGHTGTPAAYQLLEKGYPVGPSFTTMNTVSAFLAGARPEDRDSGIVPVCIQLQPTPAKIWRSAGQIAFYPCLH